MSDEEFLALHARGQESLNRYVTTNRAWRRIEQRQRLLIHMMDNDSEFLLSSIYFYFLFFLNKNIVFF
jgi:hypothetical protein